MALTAGTLPNGTTYPAAVQSLLTLFAQYLTAPNAPQAIYVSNTQPQGVPEGTGWFNPTTLEFKVYATKAEEDEPAWHVPSIPDGSIETADLKDGAVTEAKLDPAIVTLLNSLAADESSKVAKLVEPGYADSRRANFFIMLDGTLRVTGYGGSLGKNGIGYRPGGDNSYFPKRCGFSPQLAEDESVTKIYTGRHASFAITSTGKLYATGESANYMLGTGSNTPDVYVFTQVTGALTGKVVTDVAFGSGEGKYLSVFALTDDNKVYAWGRNDVGQLGVGSASINVTVPTEVTGLRPWDGAQGIKKNDGTTADKVKKIVVANTGWSSTNGSAVVSSYALTEEGHVYSAGDNGQFQLGRNGQTDQNTFGKVVNLSGSSAPPAIYVKDIAVASGGNSHNYYSVACVMNDGTVKTWGTASSGQLGTGVLTANGTPTTVKLDTSHATALGSTGDKIASIQGFGRTFVALSEAGVAWGWGWNGDGALGQGDKVNKEYAVQLGTGVRKITMGGNEGNVSIVYLKTDNTVWGAGWNNRGQLGQGTSDNSAGTGANRQITTFKQALGVPTNIADIRFTSNWDTNIDGTPSNGTGSLLVLLDSGQVMACGWDSTTAGQLGVDGSPTSLSVLSFVNF